MQTDIGKKAFTGNPALESLRILIGTWKSEGTHPLTPDLTLHGRSSFSWLADGAFLIWQSELDAQPFPDGIAIFGSDDSNEQYYLLYFDERKVSRKYEVSIKQNLITWWRNAPEFSQRYTWTISEDGNTITGKGEIAKDGSTWEQDLNLTYTRI